ncbi:cell division protein FtsQ [Persicobacter psychrovividus]|uniref:Cell division protein FtsQ n=1 Tax=Persicobacter psychrovividus TaxID=387638 RepID=A0ABM7VEN1_9BACT|nr:hypothetical protein PEPS_16950 [Persicobacter psychrovividus]
MSGRIKLKLIPKIILFAVVAGLGYFLVIVRPSERPVNHVKINVDKSFDQFFINDKEVERLMTDKGREQLLGVENGKVNLRQLESRIKDHPFVSKADVSRDYDGDLYVDVEQKRLMARLIRPVAKDAYLSEHRELLPTSDKFTARVLLIDGAFVDKIILQNQDTLKYRKELLDLVTDIHNDRFLRAQIAQLHVDQDCQITMYPQVGDERIVFGKPVSIDEKLKKLKAYYDYVIPSKGWGVYDKINLKYKDQIVCE